MKTKLFIAMSAALVLFNVGARAQITVDTVVTNGLSEPCGVTADTDGNFYIADSVNNRIARLDANTYALTTLSGISGTSGTNDGPVFLAKLYSPQGIVFTTVGGAKGLVVADTGNHSIRFVNLTNGSITTLAGLSGTSGSAVNATGAAARFTSPVGLALDAFNNLYIADSGNNAIRVMNLGDPAFGVTNRFE